MIETTDQDVGRRDQDVGRRETCPHCMTDGWVLCGECRGTGAGCDACATVGTIDCPRCFGAGMVAVANVASR